MFRSCLVLIAGMALLSAQTPTAPVINPRGVTNLFTQQPAPARVAPGGLIQITGLNLGPVEGATAQDLPWPNQLGGVAVTVNGRPAPIYSVSPGTIIAQVPWETQPSADPAEVVVRRAGAASRPARIAVSAGAVPSIRTADDSGYGAPWGAIGDTGMTLTVSGIGQANPRIANGAAGPADTPAKAANPITAFVGGLRTNASAVASSKRPGEFDLAVDVPAGAQPGDLITVLAGNGAANPTVYKPGGSPDVTYVALPDGTPDIRFISDAGLNGRYLIAAGARGDDGCSSAVAFDMLGKTAAPLPDCFTSSAAALSPLVSAAQSDTIAALIGPPQGDAQTGISTKVKIFGAAGAPVTADLPAPASLLIGTQAGYRATMPGPPIQSATIDDHTGEVRTAQAGGGGGGGVPGLGGGAFANLEIDGLNHVFATSVVQNRIVVTIGDDALKPTKAKLAILSLQGDVVGSKDFPDGWLPLLPPQQPRNPNQQFPAANPRESFALDLQARVFFALARSTDGARHAFIAFALDNSDPKVVAFPDGWFASACTPNIQVFSLELSRRAAVMASKVAETDFKQACTSSGFLLLDLAAMTVSSVVLPVQAQVLANGSSEMNDYVYAAGYDNSRTNNTSDTLFVLDGVNATTYALSIPPAVNGFNINGFARIADINSLVATATRSVQGDQGMVFFNLDAQTSTVLPVPDGFTRVATLSDSGIPCCLATRKLAARAFNGTASAGLVMYDLVTNDIRVVPNPPGVTSLGLPATAAPGGGGQGGGGGQLPPGVTLPPGITLPGGGGGAGGGAAALAAAAGGLVFANDSANTIAAVALNDTKQVGVVVVRVP